MTAMLDFPVQRRFRLKPRTNTSRLIMSSLERSYDYHESVLLAETVAALAPAVGRIILDGTLGGGGHAAALLAAKARVVGLDQDAEALEHAVRRLAEYGVRFLPVRGNFAEAGEVLDGLGIARIDGALLDLGVSSRHLDAAERGFSFMREGPLDMRMDMRGLTTGADLVNALSGEELERIFREFGEEPAARRIAARIVRERMARPVTTTLAFAQLVEAVVPRRGRAHPATRVFQALRIAVNRELDVLAQGLERISERLAPGARFAVITFHSLEDRIVKEFFKSRSVAMLDRPEWPAARPNPHCIFRKITGKPIVASEAEQRANPRSRSAKLRVVERL